MDRQLKKNEEKKQNQKYKIDKLLTRWKKNNYSHQNEEGHFRAKDVLWGYHKLLFSYKINKWNKN